MKHRYARRKPCEYGLTADRLMPLSLCFLAGAVTVSILGRGVDYTSIRLLCWSSDGSALMVIFSCILGLLLLFFSATSVFSFCLIPAAAYLFGGLVALQSATIISTGGAKIAAEIIFAVIIPGLLIVPAFMTAAAKGLLFSRQLFAERQMHRRNGGAAGFLLTYFLSITATLMAAAYIFWLLPKIL